MPWLLQMKVLLAMMARKVDWTVDLDEPVSGFPLWKPLKVRTLGVRVTFCCSEFTITYAPARLDCKALRLCEPP